MKSLPTTTPRFIVPALLVTHFHLRSGDIVADMGAGVGYFIPTLAAQVGEEGRVYACEIQKNLVEKIGDLARIQGLTQVQPLWSDIEIIGGSKIPDAVLDAAVMVNTYSQLQDRATALGEVFRTLRSGGKFFVIDWTDSFGGIGPHAERVVTAGTTEDDAETAGFILERTFDAADHHYGLAFRKP